MILMEFFVGAHGAVDPRPELASVVPLRGGYRDFLRWEGEGERWVTSSLMRRFKALFGSAFGIAINGNDLGGLVVFGTQTIPARIDRQTAKRGFADTQNHIKG
jgi:hypothetical protein